MKTIAVTAAMILLAIPAGAEEFTIYPYLYGDRNDLGVYPTDEFSSAWSVLDDPGTHDGDASYVWGIETAQYQGLKSKDTDIPAVINGTIDTVRVLIVARNHTGTFALAAFVDTIGANTESLAAMAYFGTAFDSNWYAWTVCPWSGNAWTRQDLVDLEFGIRTYFPGIGDTAIVTQCTTTVVWTPSVRLPGRRRRLPPARSQQSDSVGCFSSTHRERPAHETN